MKFEKNKLEPIMIEIEGAEYPAKLTFRALAELEAKTKQSFMEIFNKFAEGVIESKDIINILYVSLKFGSVDINFDDMYDISFSTDLFKQLTNLLERTQKVVSSIKEVDKGTGISEKK